MTLAGTCRLQFAKAVLSNNSARIRLLTIDHLRLHKTDAIGRSALVKSALPVLASLTFRKTGAYSPDEPCSLWHRTQCVTVLSFAAALEGATLIPKRSRALRSSRHQSHGCFSIAQLDTTESEAVAGILAKNMDSTSNEFSVDETLGIRGSELKVGYFSELNKFIAL